jgi:hypothetical protein
MNENENPIRLKGHNLIGEGAPFNEFGARKGTSWVRTSGVGRAKCSCGALSDELDSANKRKQWHRDHKAEIRAVSS